MNPESTPGTPETSTSPNSQPDASLALNPQAALEFKIKPFISSMLTLALFSSVPTTLIVVIAGAILLPKQPELGAILILSSGLGAYMLWRAVLAVPRKIQLEGGTISTHCTWGKRQMDLHDLRSIDRVLAWGTKGGHYYSLKLTASSGKKIYLELGALTNDDRAKLYDQLKGYFNNPAVLKSQQADYQITRTWGLV